MVNNPPLLLADEPTGNLDHRMTSDVMTLFIALHRQGTTVVFATQSQDLIHRYRYPVIQLLDGKRVNDQTEGTVKGER